MALSNAEKQARYRERNKGLKVTVTLSPEAKARLDHLVEGGMTQSSAINFVLTSVDLSSEMGEIQQATSTAV